MPADLRDCFTIVSGLEHPGVSDAHAARPRSFTGVLSSERNHRSLDQYVSASLGQQTRLRRLCHC